MNRRLLIVGLAVVLVGLQMVAVHFRLLPNSNFIPWHGFIADLLAIAALMFLDYGVWPGLIIVIVGVRFKFKRVDVFASLMIQALFLAGGYLLDGGMPADWYPVLSIFFFYAAIYSALTLIFLLFY